MVLVFVLVPASFLSVPGPTPSGLTSPRMEKLYQATVQQELKCRSARAPANFKFDFALQLLTRFRIKTPPALRLSGCPGSLGIKPQ